MKYAMISDQGLPLILVEAEAIPEGALVLPEHADLVALSRQMCHEGAWHARPVVSIEVAARVSGSPAALTVSGPGTAHVRIVDVAGQEVLLEDETPLPASWSLPDAGLYAVDVAPPAPWLPATLSFEVPA